MKDLKTISIRVDEMNHGSDHVNMQRLKTLHVFLKILFPAFILAQSFVIVEIMVAIHVANKGRALDISAISDDSPPNSFWDLLGIGAFESVKQVLCLLYAGIAAHVIDNSVLHKGKPSLHNSQDLEDVNEYSLKDDSMGEDVALTSPINKAYD